jgi:uncharacterized membrane protein HdeD (DUF308 family)
LKHWLLWFAAGIVSLLGGLFALANPLAATLAADLIAGWAFIITGGLVLISAFRDRGWGGSIMAIIAGILIILLGVNLTGHPLAGVLSLTIIAAIMLFVMGLSRIVLAFSSGLGPTRWVLVVSGALSLVLALMIFNNFPQSAALVLGVFLGIELLSNGVSMIVVALGRRPGGEVAA